MRLNIIISGKTGADCIRFGKNGYISFKGKTAQKYGFVSGERWLMGTDSDEPEPRQYLYMVKRKDEPDNEEMGFLLRCWNKNWVMAAKSLCQSLNIKPPLTCFMHPYEDDKLKGFKISLNSVVVIHSDRHEISQKKLIES